MIPFNYFHYKRLNKQGYKLVRKNGRLFMIKVINDTIDKICIG